MPQQAAEARAIAELQAFCLRREQGVAKIRQREQGNNPLLTPREQEVSVLARDRLSAKEISVSLGISIHTVNTMLRSVYRKLNISGKAELRKM